MNPHRHYADDDECPACSHEAEERKAARDEGMSEYEEARLDDWAEREMERQWGA